MNYNVQTDCCVSYFFTKDHMAYTSIVFNETFCSSCICIITWIYGCEFWQVETRTNTTSGQYSFLMDIIQQQIALVFFFKSFGYELEALRLLDSLVTL